MIADQRGRHVLVTGGTKRIGLATARAFARRGARCVLTHHFGSADERALRQSFLDEGSLDPIIVRADVSNADDTRELVAELKRLLPAVDVFISNAANALVVRTLDDYSERGLMQSVRGAVWPTYEYLFGLRDAFGVFPRHVVVLSSTGPDAFSVNYDFVAASKAMLETLCRYLSQRLMDEDICLNVIRTRGVTTESLDATFGSEMRQFLGRYIEPDEVIRAEEVADVVLALCSGLLDGVRGQTITVDRGTIFHDNITHLFAERAALELWPA